MGLLPLLHFLRQLLADEGWKLPAPRAAFVIDDPNLHWPSYGFLKYPQLAEHASRHGYHLAFATVPLDGWRVDARAVATMREHPAALSLLIHGNDHVARELAGLDSDRQAEAAMAQALRRIAALERASGLSVARVMAPPHGVCSEAALRAMFRLGFEAACISRPYPWRDGLPAPTPLAGWHPAELVAGGIPVAPRQALSAPREDLGLPCAARPAADPPRPPRRLRRRARPAGAGRCRYKRPGRGALGASGWGGRRGLRHARAWRHAARADVRSPGLDRYSGGHRHIARARPGAAWRGRLARGSLQRRRSANELQGGDWR